MIQFLVSMGITVIVAGGGLALSSWLSKRGWAIAGMPLDHCYVLALMVIGSVGMLVTWIWILDSEMDLVSLQAEIDALKLLTGSDLHL